MLSTNISVIAAGKVVRNFQKKMNSNVVHFKAFLRTDNNLEARRFFIEDPSVVTNYEYMKEKLRMVYPVLRDIIFRVTWKGFYILLFFFSLTR